MVGHASRASGTAWINNAAVLPKSWALRHRFINQETGETVRARCDSWHCLYCGPRKVDQWRQLVKVAEPTLFVTLTMVGWTVEEASRVLTTVVQYLRRGSKGKGKNHIGARPAYQIEWFAVLERHSDFERVGFHWHLLIKGVDYLPKQVVSDALASATKGRSIIVDVQRVRSRAIGYVTKYLTKHITAGEQGIKNIGVWSSVRYLMPLRMCMMSKAEPTSIQSLRTSKGRR